MKRALVSALLFSMAVLPAVSANGEEGISGTYLLFGIAIGFVLGALSTYAYVLRSKMAVEEEEKSKEILISAPGLTESENKVLLAVIGKGGEVSQDLLPKLAGLSKARISEVLSNLEKKGIIMKESKGRTNLITLKSDFSVNRKK